MMKNTLSSRQKPEALSRWLILASLVRLLNVTPEPATELDIIWDVEEDEPMTLCETTNHHFLKEQQIESLFLVP